MASSVNADSANVAALANDVKPNVGAPSPMQLYVALAKDSTNASYATRAGSATDSTKLPLAGGTMNSSAQILMTGRRVTPAAMYYSGGLQVREAAFAGTSDGYIGMAPQIGFHWGGRVASSLALGSDNKFYQVTNGGSVNALATESYVNSKVSSANNWNTVQTVNYTLLSGASLSTWFSLASVRNIYGYHVKKADILFWSNSYDNGQDVGGQSAYLTENGVVVAQHYNMGSWNTVHNAQIVTLYPDKSYYVYSRLVRGTATQIRIIRIYY